MIDRSLPLVDLHRHLDGNVRLTTVIDIARQHGVALPASEPATLRPHVEVMGQAGSLIEFLAKFEVLQRVFVDEEAIERIACENVEDAAHEGLAYVELRLSPAFMGERYGIDPQRVMAAVCRGVRAGTARSGVRAQVIGIMARHLGPETAWVELAAAIDHMPAGVVAIDLAGDEAGFPGELFVDHMRRARAAGLRVTVHAGEAAGAASVRQAIEQLGAERIGHGVRAREDEAVMQLILERGIVIESCPTSNVQTCAVATLADHPLPMFLERGVRVTLATDDPSISGIDLAHEYAVAHTELGLSADQLRQLQRMGLDAAFLPAAERAALAGR